MFVPELNQVEEVANKLGFTVTPNSLKKMDKLYWEVNLEFRPHVGINVGGVPVGINVRVYYNEGWRDRLDSAMHQYRSGALDHFLKRDESLHSGIQETNKF